MSGRRMSDEERELYERYEHFGTFKECQSNAVQSGLRGLVLGVGGTMVGLYALKRYTPLKSAINNNMFIGLPLGAGSVACYWIVRKKASECAAAFAALEGRNTALMREAGDFREDDDY